MRRRRRFFPDLLSYSRSEDDVWSGRVPQNTLAKIRKYTVDIPDWIDLDEVTVWDLKRHLKWAGCGLAPAHMKLRFRVEGGTRTRSADRELDDAETLGSCGVTSEAVLILDYKVTRVESSDPVFIEEDSLS